MFIQLNEESPLTWEMLTKKKYRYIALVRTSTTKQSAAMKLQEEELVKDMKRYGFGEPLAVFAQNVTGKSTERKQIKQILDFLTAIPEKKRNVMVACRDIERFARNVTEARLLLQKFGELGVYLFISQTGMILGGDGREQSNNLLFVTIQLAMAEFAKRGEAQASIKAAQASKEKGIFSGTPKDSYITLVRREGSQKGKSIYRRIYEAKGGFEAGLVTTKGIARELSNRAQTLYPKKVREIRRMLDDLEQLGGKKKVEEYLNVWDAIIAEERKENVGARVRKGKSMSNRANAIHRVTVAYLNDPMGFPEPVKAGNPETARIQSPDRTGTIEDASNNPDAYNAARRGK